MRIVIYNDTRPYHCGCEAVMAYIEDVLSGHGHELRGGYLNYGNQPGKAMQAKGMASHRPISEDDLAWCDAVLVNGEGGGRSRFNLHSLLCALDANKAGYLVNSTWHQDVSQLWKSVLPRLTAVSLRGSISMQYAISCGAKATSHHLDFSYYAAINERSLYTDFGNAEVCGDFYELESNRAALERLLADMPVLPMIPRICDWSYLVKSLRTASLYVTGRHHGMYAACKARTPFVIYKRENHKMLDLMHTAGIHIPYPETPAEMVEAIKWARKNRDVYERLFDWMEAHPRWSGV